MFQLYIYGVSVAFLAYMHFYVMNYKEDYRDSTRLPKTCIELGPVCSSCDAGRVNSLGMDNVGKTTDSMH